MTKPTSSGRLALALLAAGAAFGGLHGFAASLGAGTGGLGAGSEPVAACGAGLTISYSTAFDPGIAGSAITGVSVSSIPPGCRGRSLSVSFYGDGGKADGEAIRTTLPSSGASADIAVDPRTNTIDAGGLSGVSVAVS